VDGIEKFLRINRVDDEVVFQVRNKNTVITIVKTNGKRQTVLTTVTPSNTPREP